MRGNRFSRRYFFYGSLLSGAVPAGGFGSAPSLPQVGYRSPNEKLNVAGIGAGNRALEDLPVVASTENIVALADVDDRRAAQGFATWPKANRYRDFRKMLDKEGKNVDACVIAIPDHNHAYAALACMERGKHVYVEKPLARTPWEARMLTRAAAKYGVATQMGNQGHSSDGARVAAEIVWSGEIGDVTEVHAWHGYPAWPQGMQTVPPDEPVPSTLDWDLWLGTAAWRPYTSGGYDELARGGAGGNLSTAYAGGFYLPFNWRGFYDFGTGLVGDWAVHIIGPANQALRLGNPLSVECVKQEGKSPFTYPQKCVIKYSSARAATCLRSRCTGTTLRPATRTFRQVWISRAIGWTAQLDLRLAGWREPLAGRCLWSLRALPRLSAARSRRRRWPWRRRTRRRWRDGVCCPRLAGRERIHPRPWGPRRDRATTQFRRQPNSGGDKGLSGHTPLRRGRPLASQFQMGGSQASPRNILTRSPGHQRDWIRACKGGSPPCSDFSFSGPFTEWLVLGAIAVRFEGKLLWDAAKMEFTNNKAATRYVKPAFRAGWTIKDV